MGFITPGLWQILLGVTKYRMMISAGNVARVGEEICIEVLVEEPESTGQLFRLRRDDKTPLKCTLNMQVCMAGIGFKCLMIRTAAGLSEHSMNVQFL